MARPTTSIKVTGTTIPGNGTTGIIPMDYRGGNFQCTIQVVVSGTGTYSVQYTADPINDVNSSDITNGGYTNPWPESSVNWFNHATLSGITSSGISNIAFPVTAVRLIGTSFSSGYAFMRIIQTPVAQ